MNQLAAAYLAAQGWDGQTNQLSQQQADQNGQQNGMQYQAANASGLQTDLKALLANPAILQALNSQVQGNFQHTASVQPAQHSIPDQGNAFSQNLTPGQTTRSGRISRPPVIAPVQDQLSLLQQILGGPSGSNTQQQAVQATSSSAPPSSLQARPEMSAGQQSTARTAGVKRPHSALRDASNSAQPVETANIASEEAPLVRPVPTSINGRPRKGDSTSKEERLERRRIQNSQSAADYRKKKELYIQSLEDRLKDKELEVKAKAAECEKWRQKFVDMEKQHAVLTALWTAAGYSLPDGNGNMQLGDRLPQPGQTMLPPQLGRPAPSNAAAQAGLRTMAESRTAPSMSPASMNPPIRSPLPLVSAHNTPPNFPSPVHQPTPLASASNTLGAGLATANHPTMSPLTTLPGSSPAETPDNQPFDFGVDLSAFDDFFNWDIMPDNDADDQQDADFIPASSPKRDSDSGSEDETDAAGQTSKKRKKRKGKSKQKTRDHERGEDDDDFVDPEEDEEDLFMPITDVDVPPGQMQLVEKATQDVMSTFGVDSQVQLTGVMQKIVDAGDGLTGEQLEKMKSVLRWMQMSGHLPGHHPG